MERATTELTVAHNGSITEKPAVDCREQSGGRRAGRVYTEPAICRESVEAMSDRGSGSPAPNSEPELEWDYYDTDQYLGAAVSLVHISSPSVDLSDVDLFGSDDVSDDSVAATTKMSNGRTRSRRRQHSAHARDRCHNGCESTNGCQGADSNAPWRRVSNYFPPCPSGRGWRGQRTEQDGERKVYNGVWQDRPYDGGNSRGRGRGRGRARAWRGGWRGRDDRGRGRGRFQGRGRGGPGRGGWPTRDRPPAINESNGAETNGRPAPTHDGNWRWRGRGQLPANRWQQQQRRRPSSDWWMHDCQRIEKPTATPATSRSRHGSDDIRSRDASYTPAHTQLRTSTQDCRYSNTADTRT